MKKCLLFLLVLNIPLDSDYFLVYRGLRHAGSTNGFSVNVADIILMVLYFVWVLEEMGKEKSSVFWPKAAIPALGFIIAGILSMYNAPVKMLSFYEIILLCKMFLLFFYTANCIKSENDIKVVASALIVGMAIQSVLSYVQLHTGHMYSLHYFLSTGYPELRHGVDRVKGTFGGCAYLAGFLASLLPLTVGITFFSRGLMAKGLSLLCFVLGMIALILTLSRGGWMSIFVSFLVMMILGLRNRLLPLRKVLAASFVALFVFVLFMSTVVSRIEDPAAKVRIFPYSAYKCEYSIHNGPSGGWSWSE
jgi:hypothetical protein